MTGSTSPTRPARGRRVARLAWAWLATAAAASTAVAESWRSELYPHDWTPPALDSRFYQDRLIQDFSHAGYHRGDRPLPDVEGPVADVTTGRFDADPTGRRDSTDAIQAAIDAVQRAGGGVVRLPPGTFRVRPPEGRPAALEISASHVVLRGAGVDRTFIVNTSHDMRGRSVIRVSGPGEAGFTGSNRTLQRITMDLPGPTQVVPVADSRSFRPGDLVVVRSEATEAWLQEHEPRWVPHARRFAGLSYPRRVLAIDRDRHHLLLDAPTRYALWQRDSARVERLGAEPLAEVGLEDFSIGNLEHPDHDASGWVEAAFGNSSAAAYQTHGSALIRLERVWNSWVRRVESFRPEDNTLDTHFLSNGLIISHCRGLTIKEVVMRNSLYGGAGGNGYHYRFTNSADNLVIRCVSDRNRHGFVFSSMGTSGNVIHDCLDRETRRAVLGRPSGSGSDHHMHFSHSNLVDQCVADNSFFASIYRPHGSHPQHLVTAAHSVFWNIESRGNQHGDVVKTQQARYGYVIGTSGPRPGVATGSRRPNTDPIDHVEGRGRGADLQPQSLYLDQLAARQGGLRIHGLDPEPVPLPQRQARLAPMLEAGPELLAAGRRPDYRWTVVRAPGPARFTSDDTLRTTLEMTTAGSHQVRFSARLPQGEWSREFTVELAR